MDIEPIVAWIKEPLAAGNIIKGVERCVDEMQRTQKPLFRQWLIRELVQLLQGYAEGLSAREQQRVREIVGHDPELEAHLFHILDAGTGIQPKPSVEVPGKARGLFVIDGPEPFGCVHELRAKPMPGRGGGIQMVNPQADALMPRALIAAGFAVQGWLTARGLTRRGRGVYLTYDIPVEVGTISQAYEGGSIGLAGAIALFSGITEQPVPPTYAFTGYVDIGGTVHAVGGIREKLEAAADKGITTVFLPAANVREVPESYRSMVQGVSMLGEVIEQLFDSRQIDRCIERFNRASSDAAMRAEAFEQRASGGERVLISCIGERDPYGDPKFRQISEGAVLTAFRKVMPRAICLLATSGVQQAGELTERELQAIAPLPQCEVTLEPLAVDDPTDYDALAAEMGRKVRGFLQQAEATLGQERGVEPYLVISSGTPQMHAVWVYLLNTEETLRGARVLQVREPRFVRDGEERVREVASHFLQIGSS